MLADNAWKVDEADKKSVEEKIKEVKDILAKTEATKEEFETVTKPLNDIMMQVWQKVYSQPGAEQPWAEQATGWEEQKADDWVVDAEVEDEDNKWWNTRV
jgi:molecular chaperone DnaK